MLAERECEFEEMNLIEEDLSIALSPTVHFR